jgi:hypothetical protein
VTGRSARSAALILLNIDRRELVSPGEHSHRSIPHWWIRAPRRQSAHLFIQVFDLYLGDVHAMLRIPRPEVEISEGCNFAISAALMNAISGVSLALYEPPANRSESRRCGALRRCDASPRHARGRLRNVSRERKCFFQAPRAASQFKSFRREAEMSVVAMRYRAVLSRVFLVVSSPAQRHDSSS